MLKKDKMSLNMYELVLIWFSATTTLWEVWLRFTFWDVFSYSMMSQKKTFSYPQSSGPKRLII